MNMEAEIGVIQPKAKECVEPPKAGRSKEGLSPSFWRECSSSADTLISDFWPPEL